MRRAQQREIILGKMFFQLLKESTGRSFSECVFGDKPDVICKDNSTGKVIGIEITELLSCDQGRARSWSEKAKLLILEILTEYAPGGIISIDFGSTIPEDINKLREICKALRREIRDSGDLKQFSRRIELEGYWIYHLHDSSELEKIYRRLKDGQISEDELREIGEEFSQVFIISSIDIRSEDEDWSCFTNAPLNTNPRL